MIVFRLAKAQHAALDGEGARLYGGRWNSPGRPMVYASANPSLAVLEVMVHLDLPLELAPDDYQIIDIAAPDDAPREILSAVPVSLDACQSMGDDFLERGEALMLWVPSIVVPQEHNVLFNPRQPAMNRVRLAGARPFRFDPRLFASAGT